MKLHCYWITLGVVVVGLGSGIVFSVYRQGFLAPVAFMEKESRIEPYGGGITNKVWWSIRLRDKGVERRFWTTWSSNEASECYMKIKQQLKERPSTVSHYSKRE